MTEEQKEDENSVGMEYTKEELEKEAIAKYKTGSYPQLHPDHYAFIHGYLASAEPREKQIQIDAEQIRALQKQNGELTDKVNDLEDKLANADYQLEGRDNEIRELEAQIEKMKCCYNCKHSRTEYEHCKTDKSEKWEAKENE